MTRDSLKGKGNVNGFFNKKSIEQLYMYPHDLSGKRELESGRGRAETSRTTSRAVRRTGHASFGFGEF